MEIVVKVIFRVFLFLKRVEIWDWSGDVGWSGEGEGDVG